MDYLHKQDPSDTANQPVLTYTLNPKCVTMGELYGEYNLLSNEWKDGLASSLIRWAVSDDSLVRKWLVFDGPVDPLWIENMNTVRSPFYSCPKHQSDASITCPVPVSKSWAGEH